MNGEPRGYLPNDPRKQPMLAEGRHDLQQYQQQPYPARFEEEEEAGIDFREYLRVILRHKMTIIVVVLVALVATVIATSMQVPIYKASGTLQIDRQASRVLQYEGVEAPQSYNWEFYETQYQLLRSRAVARRVVDKLGLDSSKAFQPEEQQSFFKDLTGWVRNIGQPQVAEEVAAEPESDPRAALADILAGSLEVKPVKDSALVQIAFDSPNAKLAADVVNTLMTTFIDLSMERNFERSSYAKEFLSERIKQIRANLEDSERKLVEYAGDREIIDMEQKQSVLVAKVQALNSKLVEVEASRIEAESKMRVMESSGAYVLGLSENNSAIDTYKSKLAELETEYQEKLRVYKPAYPAMVQLQTEISEIRKKVEQEIADIGKNAQARYQAALREEAMLQASMAELKAQILDLQKRSTDYQALKRDVETNRELYDGLLQRIKEVGVAAGISDSNISVVDPARTPSGPYKPNLRRNLLIALLLGLAGGIGLAFLFEHLDDSVKSADQLEKLTGRAVLGVIPEVERPENEAAVAMMVQNQPTSALAEAYRSMRTALSFSTASGSPKVLHLTSSVPGEGKTTSSISLAVTYAQAGQNVLLIDADLRNPSLHRDLGLGNEIGLTNILAGDRKPSEAVRRSNMQRFWVLTTGPIPPNPAELLGTSKMADLLETAATKFDLVILDSPPVLGLADALILANMANATILVVDAGVTRKGSVEGALARLRQARANILGTVLTKYGQGGSGYGYDYHYRYKYDYYGYGTREADESAAEGQRQTA